MSGSSRFYLKVNWIEYLRETSGYLLSRLDQNWFDNLLSAWPCIIFEHCSESYSIHDKNQSIKCILIVYIELRYGYFSVTYNLFRFILYAILSCTNYTFLLRFIYRIFIQNIMQIWMEFSLYQFYYGIQSKTLFYAIWIYTQKQI